MNSSRGTNDGQHKIDDIFAAEFGSFKDATNFGRFSGSKPLKTIRELLEGNDDRDLAKCIHGDLIGAYIFKCSKKYNEVQTYAEFHDIMRRTRVYFITSLHSGNVHSRLVLSLVHQREDRAEPTAEFLFKNY